MKSLWIRDIGEARWLSRRRLRLWSFAFLFIFAEFLLVGGFHPPKGAPPDFLALWAAGRMIRDGDVAQVYSWDAHAAVMQTQINFSGFLPWLHLPTALFLVTLFGLLPYHVAFVVWVGSGGALYVWSVYRIVGSWPVALGSLGAAVSVWNAYSGQTGFVLAAAVAGLFLLVGRRPVLAGLCLSVFVLKPQLAVMLPLVLVAQRQWRVLISAALATFAVVGASILTFGWHRWPEFLSTSRIIAQSVDNGDAGFKVESVYGTARVLGLPAPAATVVYGGIVVAVGWFLWTRARRPSSSPPLVAATAIVATLVAAPRILTYDMQILVMACGFLAVAARESGGFLRYEKVLIFLALVSPLLAMVDLPSGMVGVFVVGGLLIRRWARTAPPGPAAEPGVAAAEAPEARVSAAR